MDCLDLLNKYSEVAEFINDSATKSLLGIFERQLNEREFLLPFMGQFSAGKSKLINHILGRDILPTRRTETTAFPTYIQYGEEDVAILIHSDNSTEKITFADVKELNYQKVKDIDNPITSLKLFVNNPILSTGLIIVDTPGVNTLINEHVNMTEELLTNSMYVVYVFPGELTKQDLMMIEKIEGLNINCVFVRTHADCIKKVEEDISVTIMNEGETLNNKLGKTVPFYAVTNEEDCNDKNLLDMNFDFLKDFLQNGIAANIDDNYKHAILGRLEGIRVKLEKSINEKIHILESTSNQSEKNLEKNERNIKLAKQKLKKIISLNEERIRNREENILTSISENIHSKYEMCLRNFKSAVRRCNFNSEQEASAEYQRLLSDNIMQMGSETSKYISAYAEESVCAMNEEMSHFIDDIQNESGISFDINFDMSTIAEVEQKQKLLEEDFNEKYVQLNHLKEMSDEKLSSLGVERSNLEDTIAQFDSTIAECQKVRNEAMSSYTPHYIDVQGSCPSIFKKIGNLCDLAMLAIPGTGFAKGAAFATKGAKALSKGNKLLQLGGQGLTQVAKGLDMLAKTDRIKDTATLLKSVPEVLNGKGASRIDKKKGSLLDYLSVSYWFEKVGEVINPPTKILDRQYENEFNEKMRELQVAVQNKVQDRLLLLRRNGYIKDEMDAQIKRQEMLKEETLNLEQRYKSERQKFERMIMDKTQEVFRENMYKKFELNLHEFKNILNKKSRDVIVQMRYRILDAVNHVTIEKLENIENQLSEIRVNKQNGVNNNLTAIKELICMKEKLSLDK